MRGHIFCADRYLGFDDAIYASARLFEIIAGSDRPLSEMLSHLPPVVSTPEIRVECPDEIKFRVAERVAEIVRPQAREVIGLDGGRGGFGGGGGPGRGGDTPPGTRTGVRHPSPPEHAACRSPLPEAGDIRHPRILVPAVSGSPDGRVGAPGPVAADRVEHTDRSHRVLLPRRGRDGSHLPGGGDPLSAAPGLPSGEQPPAPAPGGPRPDRSLGGGG